jgi:hypothetical protein
MPNELRAMKGHNPYAGYVKRKRDEGKFKIVVGKYQWVVRYLAVSGL